VSGGSFLAWDWFQGRDRGLGVSGMGDRCAPIGPSTLWDPGPIPSVGAVTYTFQRG
jgi:hypothetical protein